MVQLQKDFRPLLVHGFHQSFVAFDLFFVADAVLPQGGPAERMRYIGMTGDDQADAAGSQVFVKFQLKFASDAVFVAEPVLGRRADKAVAIGYRSDLIGCE